MFDKIKKHGFVCIIFFVALAVFLMNVMTPLYADDYTYGINIADASKLETVEDVIQSSISHYQTINGRLLAPITSQFLFMVGNHVGGKMVFNVFHTFLFIVMGLAICFIATGKKPTKTPIALAAVYIIQFLFSPGFGESYLWISGAATHMYGVAFAFLYFIPFRLKQRDLSKYECVPARIGLFIYSITAGLLVGASSENVSVAIIVLTWAFAAYYKLCGAKLRLWMLGLGNIAGCLIMLLAPGQNDRLDGSGGFSISNIVKMFIHISLDIAEYMFPLIVVLAICLAVAIKAARAAEGGRAGQVVAFIKEHFIALAFSLAFLASTYSMIMAPRFAARAWCGPLAFLIVALISACNTARPLNVYALPKAARVTTAIIIIVGCIGTYANATTELSHVQTAYKARLAIIKSAQQAEQTEVCLPAIQNSDRYSCFGAEDLSWDEEAWQNEAMAKYYGFDKIIRDDSLSK